MSAPAFTPGPWSVPHQGPREEGWDVLAGKRRVALIPGSNNRQRIPDDEDRANARLIAAAPNLLEAARAALESVETWHDDAPRDCDCDDCQRVLPMLRAALAKAEGR